MTSERERGRPIKLRGDVPTLTDFAHEWQRRRYSQEDIALNTGKFDAALLTKHIAPYLGHLSLVDLTVARLVEWQAECLENGTPYMTQRAQILLGQILDDAARLGHIEQNPVRSLRGVKHSHREGIALSPTEVEKLRGWFLKRERLTDATLVSVMAYAGPRTEEALAMQWSNLHGSRYYVEHKNADGRLVPKGGDKKGKPRWVELPKAVVTDLATLRLAQSSHGLIFPTPTGLPWTATNRGNWRRRYFSKAAKAIGYPELQPRHLRHTCASLLAATNTPRIEIQEQMGHRVDTSERVYQHLVPELRGSRLGLDELIAAARGEVHGARRVA